MKPYAETATIMVKDASEFQRGGTFDMAFQQVVQNVADVESEETG